MLPPGLSMLWESADPRSALSERFGFEDLAAAERWIRDALAESWGLRVRSCTRLVLSDHNVIAWLDGEDGGLVMKWSREQQRFPALAAATGLLAHLDAHGVPVAAPVPTPDGEVRAVLEGPRGPLSAAVLPEVSGNWLDVGDPHAVRDAGRVLARLHDALASAPVVPEVRAPHAAPLPDRIAHWLAESDRGLAPEGSRRLAALLDAAPLLEPSPQLVHHDVRAANILVEDSRVVAMLDLDEVGLAPRVEDLARASTYLATLFRDWGPTSEAARGALRAGYEQVHPLGGEESAWLEILTLWHGLAAIPEGAGRERWAAALPAL